MFSFPPPTENLSQGLDGKQFSISAMLATLMLVGAACAILHALTRSLHEEGVAILTAEVVVLTVLMLRRRPKSDDQSVAST